MTEEQIKQKFKEIYPDFMRGNEPLSPYFDIWEYAIEIATKELQEENEELQAKYLSESYEKAKLVEQIEKMKCCYNCKHSRTEYEHCKTDKSEKWEIKEK